MVDAYRRLVLVLEKGQLSKTRISSPDCPVTRTPGQCKQRLVREWGLQRLSFLDGGDQIKSLFLPRNSSCSMGRRGACFPTFRALTCLNGGLSFRLPCQKAGYETL